MRKLFAVAAMLVFIFAASSIYACGEESGAGGSKASYEKTEKAETAKTVAADYKSEEAEFITVDYSRAGKSACCQAKGETARVEVMKADARTVKAYCPATEDCPAPCVKDAKAENIKTENTEEKNLPSASSFADPMAVSDRQNFKEVGPEQ